MKVLISDIFPKTNKPIIILFLITILGCILRDIKLFEEIEYYGRDEIYYCKQAESISKSCINEFIQSQNDSFYIPAGYLLILSKANIFQIDYPLFGRLVTLFCSTIFITFFYCFTNFIFNEKKIGLIAAFLTAINPYLIRQSVQTSRDIPFLLLSGIGCLLFIKHNYLGALGAGFMFALSSFIKHSMLLFIVCLFVYTVFCLFTHYRYRTHCIKKFCIMSLSLLISTFILLLIFDIDFMYIVSIYLKRIKTICI